MQEINVEMEIIEEFNNNIYGLENSILNTKIIDTNDMANKFLRGVRNAEYRATNETFDIGRTTLQALAKYEMKLDKASSCRESSEYSNGNGLLM